MVGDVKEAIRLTAWIRNRWEKPSTLALVLLAIGVWDSRLVISMTYQESLRDHMARGFNSCFHHGSGCYRMVFFNAASHHTFR